MNDVDDVIEAFVDGEPVEPQRLTGVLATAEGRALFVDLLVLRGLVGGQPVMRAVAAEPIRARVASRARVWTAAAAIAGAGLFGGYLLGMRVTVRQTTPAIAAATSAPAPTHVIRLESGVDWTESGGGQ